MSIHAPRSRVSEIDALLGAPRSSASISDSWFRTARDVTNRSRDRRRARRIVQAGGSELAVTFVPNRNTTFFFSLSEVHGAE